MPNVSSYPDVTDDWLGVLDASSKSPDLQPLIETERQALTQVLAEVQGSEGAAVGAERSASGRYEAAPGGGCPGQGSCAPDPFDGEGKDGPEE